ncbi:MAG: nonstructural protein [Microviridae sp.]|nr:MAG: nonstructural protein [Microviridae sp.]
MAKQMIVSVFDTAVQAHGRPLFVPTKGAAMRSFTDEVNRQAEDNPMWAHPEDYELYLLGWFDDSSGIVGGNLHGPELVARAKDVKI